MFGMSKTYRNPNQTSRCENYICLMKNSLGRTNTRLDIVQERINKPEDTATETIQNETQREKRT